ncbi:MAG: hypothetical protein ACP5OB_06290 [Candidatus Ratteibacteria bacterium]
MIYEKVLKELSKERPVFHSESDFQHALAWKIHQKYPNLKIRLEKREEINNEEIYFDIFIFGCHRIYAIELKYKTAKLEITLPNLNERYILKKQGAQDQARYDFCKDIERLEKFFKKYKGTGFAVFLTNDSMYWKKPSKNLNTNDKEFRIHQGKILKGCLKWKEGASQGTIQRREEGINLTGTYQ